MKRFGVISATLLLSLCLAWADGSPIGIVVAVSGEVVRAQDPGQKPKYPVKLLTSVKVDNEFSVPAGASLTISVVRTGSRYRITGPASFKINRQGEFDPPNVAIEEPKHSSRAAIIASDKPDLSKYGGGSGRFLGGQIYISRPHVQVNSALFPELDSAFSSRPTHEIPCCYYDDPKPITIKTDQVKHCKARTIHHGDHDDLELVGPELQAGHSYLVWLNRESIEEVDPAKSKVDFRVNYLGEDVLAEIHDFEEDARTVEDQMELTMLYANYYLFEDALRVLDSIQGLPADAKSEAANKIHENQRGNFSKF